MIEAFRNYFELLTRFKDVKTLDMHLEVVDNHKTMSNKLDKKIVNLIIVRISQKYLINKLKQYLHIRNEERLC